MNPRPSVGRRMYFVADSLDQLQFPVLEAVLRSPTRVPSAKKGSNRELTGVLLELTNPRKRLSRTKSRGVLFSCLGELLWYLSGSDDVEPIAYYLPQYRAMSDDGVSVHGSYGPRLFDMRGIDQLSNVVNRLKSHPDSRQVVLQLFDAADVEAVYRDVPCTCALQFLLRHERLHMMVFMRSNDVIRGLTHDVFAFTMLQELVASSIGVEMGFYKHAVGSLHLYDRDIQRARETLKERWTKPAAVEMPAMPNEDPWPSVQRVLDAEVLIRGGMQVDAADMHVGPYWGELIRLLLAYSSFRQGDQAGLRKIRKQLSFPDVYGFYIDRKLEVLREHASKKGTRPLDPETLGR